MKKILSLVLALFSFVVTFAQVVPPPPPTGEADGPGAPDIAIDSNIIILVVIAIFMVIAFARNWKSVKH